MYMHCTCTLNMYMYTMCHNAKMLYNNIIMYHWELAKSLRPVGAVIIDIWGEGTNWRAVTMTKNLHGTITRWMMWIIATVAWVLVNLEKCFYTFTCKCTLFQVYHFITKLILYTLDNLSLYMVYTLTCEGILIRCKWYSALFQEVPARFLSCPLNVLRSMGVACILEAAQSFSVGTKKRR